LAYARAREQRVFALGVLEEKEADLPIRVVAELVCLDPSTVYKHIKKGKMPGTIRTFFGEANVRVNVHELRDWLKEYTGYIEATARQALQKARHLKQSQKHFEEYLR
jgi:predicted DNA-binding transcriptional regulator AlpA